MRLCPALLLLAACGDDVGAPDAGPPTGAITAEVASYDLHFDLESRAATATLTLVTTTAGDCVRLPFRGAQLGAAAIDGAPATRATVDTSVVLHPVLEVCGAGWPAGTTLGLTVDLEVARITPADVEVGYSISDDLGGQPFYYLLSWVEGCDQFAPCDTRPDRFAHYHFTVDHPSGVTVLCPGTLTPGDRTSACDFQRDGGPTYSSFGLVASANWTAVDLGHLDGVATTLYDMPEVGYADEVEPGHIAGFLRFMAAHFGPYPYGHDLRLIVGPTVWSGFEHPGNIVLSDQLHAGGFPAPLYARPLSHTIDHELAHQWAGDQTTLAGTYDFVWKESMAEYLAFVYEDEAVSPEVADRTAKAWKAFAAAASTYPVPTDHPALAHFYGNVYGPGPMILFRQLEAMYGRPAIMAALESLLGQPRALSLAEVEAALASATGADLGTYFATWLEGTGAPRWPRFTVTLSDLGRGMVEVAVAQVAPDQGLYGCAFTIALDGAAGERFEVPFDLGPDGMATASRTVTPGFVPTGFQFDVHHETLATLAGAIAAPSPVAPWHAPRPPRPHRPR